MDKYFDIEVKVCRVVLNIFGLWPSLDREINYEIYLRFTVLLVVILGFCNVPQTAKLFDSTSSFDEMLEIITNCNITNILALTKTLNVWFNREALSGLLIAMAKDWKLVKSKAEKIIMQKNAKLSHMISMIVFWVCESAVLAFLMLNGYNRVKEWQTFKEGNFNESERIRPLYMLSKFPYDVQKTPYYEITWICQFLSTLFGASLFAATDAFFLAFVLHLCAQMKNLRGRLKNLLAHAAMKGRESNHLDLSSIIERHKDLICFAGTIENIFNLQFLVQLLSSLLIFCLIGYQIVSIITKEVVPVLELLFAAYYYISFAGSLFGYCLIAMILSAESTKLKETVYNSDWYELSASNAKLLILIMIRTSQPFELTAGKFVALSLDLYCSVLKTSGGYLSMLLAVRNRFPVN